MTLFNTLTTISRDPAAPRTITTLFQRRHLLAHREGMVDQKYLDKSGDPGYTVGQRIVVKERDVMRMAQIIRKLVNGIWGELS